MNCQYVDKALVLVPNRWQRLQYWLATRGETFIFAASAILILGAVFAGAWVTGNAADSLQSQHHELLSALVAVSFVVGYIAWLFLSMRLVQGFVDWQDTHIRAYRETFLAAPEGPEWPYAVSQDESVLIDVSPEPGATDGVWPQTEEEHSSHKAIKEEVVAASPAPADDIGLDDAAYAAKTAAEWAERDTERVYPQVEGLFGPYIVPEEFIERRQFYRDRKDYYQAILSDKEHAFRRIAFDEGLPIWAARWKENRERTKRVREAYQSLSKQGFVLPGEHTLRTNK